MQQLQVYSVVLEGRSATRRVCLIIGRVLTPDGWWKPVQTARDDWRWVFLWDSGEGSIWNGRYLDHFGQYPQDVCVASGSGGCSVHNDGRMWATTLMEVWDDLGREVTDHLVLLSHYYLQAPVYFCRCRRSSYSGRLRLLWVGNMLAC